VEKGPTADVLSRHRHRYTQALLQSRLELDTPPHSRVATIAGQPPRPAVAPVGCRFAARCAHATEECSAADPPHVRVEGRANHVHRCIWPSNEPARLHAGRHIEQLG
jgi:oligopeptide/dipeptide ABC transporter ATP-binding protein